jgi:hypothetical protein
MWTRYGATVQLFWHSRKRNDAEVFLLSEVHFITITVRINACCTQYECTVPLLWLGQSVCCRCVHRTIDTECLSGWCTDRNHLGGHGPVSCFLWCQSRKTRSVDPASACVCACARRCRSSKKKAGISGTCSLGTKEDVWALFCSSVETVLVHTSEEVLILQNCRVSVQRSVLRI